MNYILYYITILLHYSIICYHSLLWPSLSLITTFWGTLLLTTIFAEFLASGKLCYLTVCWKNSENYLWPTQFGAIETVASDATEQRSKPNMPLGATRWFVQTLKRISVGNSRFVRLERWLKSVCWAAACRKYE